jgi:hypothetical protein
MTSISRPVPYHFRLKKWGLSQSEIFSGIQFTMQKNMDFLSICIRKSKSQKKGGSEILNICICQLDKITVFLGGNSKNSNFGLKYRNFRPDMQKNLLRDSRKSGRILRENRKLRTGLWGVTPNPPPHPVNL